MLIKFKIINSNFGIWKARNKVMQKTTVLSIFLAVFADGCAMEPEQKNNESSALNNFTDMQTALDSCEDVGYDTEPDELAGMINVFNKQQKEHGQLLVTAIERENSSLLLAALKEGADIDATDLPRVEDTTATPLIVAISNDCKKIA